MRWMALVVSLSLAFGLDLNSIKNESLNYANQGGSIGQNTRNRAENIICTQGGADCSYQGQDLQNFSQEAQARQEYLNQANDPQSALGRALSTIWSTSDIKSTLFYQKAEELYQCAQVSPDGKCQMYVGESYYGECQTVQECVSQTTQQTYAEYMCYVDAQGQTTGGETKHLCYVYNRIEPTVKEKEYVCHVINTESIRTCNKDLQLDWGRCNIQSVNATGTIYWAGRQPNYPLTVKGLGNKLVIKAPNVFSDVIEWQSPGGEASITIDGTSLDGEVVITGVSDRLHYISLIGNGNQIEVWVVYYCISPFGVPCTPPPAEYKGSITSSVHVTGSVSLRLWQVWCLWCSGYIKGQANSIVDTSNNSLTFNVNYKCSLTNQTYASKTECYQNCYTEQIQDCQVQ